jgi:hypothetical protein
MKISNSEYIHPSRTDVEEVAVVSGANLIVIIADNRAFIVDYITNEVSEAKLLKSENKQLLCVDYFSDDTILAFGGKFKGSLQRNTTSFPNFHQPSFQ